MYESTALKVHASQVNVTFSAVLKMSSTFKLYFSVEFRHYCFGKEMARQSHIPEFKRLEHVAKLLIFHNVVWSQDVAHEVYNGLGYLFSRLRIWR